MSYAESVRGLVRESYDRLGDRYAAWARGVQGDGRGEYLEFILRELPPGSRVLDLGCGDGSLLTARLSEPFDVVGVDISRVQLARAREHAPRASFICADISQLWVPLNSFDAVTAFYCLTHLPRTDLPLLLERVAGWLQPDGHFVASFGSRDEPGGVDPEWLGVPMFFSGHAPEENRRLLADSGFVIDQEHLRTDNEYGQRATFHWIAAHAG